MSLAENLLLAAALAADAFAVAIVRGMTGQGRNGDRLATGFLLCGGADGYAGFGISAGDGCGGAAGAPGRGSACRKHSFPAGRKDAARRNV